MAWIIECDNCGAQQRTGRDAAFPLGGDKPWSGLPFKRRPWSKLYDSKALCGDCTVAMNSARSEAINAALDARKPT